MIRRTRSSSRAFTLVEVLATMALMGVLIPVVMQGISLSLHQAAQAKRSVEAAALAESKLSELIAQASYQAGASSGDFGPELAEYRWAAESAVRDLDLNEIHVQVYWMARDKEHSVSLSTMVYTGAVQGAGSVTSGMQTQSGGQGGAGR